MLSFTAPECEDARFGFDYVVEDGEMLHETDWNGECYTVKKKELIGICNFEISYYPVYEEVEEDYFVIIGFERR